MTRFFAAHSAEQAGRAIPAGAPVSADLDGTLSTLPLATLKHVARAAQVASRDVAVQRRIDLLIDQQDVRGLSRYVESLGAAGKLGTSWSPEEFLTSRGVRRSKSRAGRRTARKRAETGADMLRRRATLVARRITAKLAVTDEPVLKARFDAALRSSRGGSGTLDRRDAIDNLEQMIALLPHVNPVDPRTWRKLTDLVRARDRAKASTGEQESRL